MYDIVSEDSVMLRRMNAGVSVQTRMGTCSYSSIPLLHTSKPIWYVSILLQSLILRSLLVRYSMHLCNLLVPVCPRRCQLNLQCAIVIVNIVVLRSKKINFAKEFLPDRVEKGGCERIVRG
jgi:hypothetical protein